MGNQEENKSYILSQEQQNILDEQVDLDITEYTEASKLYLSLKVKYELN